ncbi:hypothetical protein AC249_AIPGENE7980 [Exaiptasia diaphana]|nr:hypothetical protein AC249_AIPGENE7980 [Exaiptasia diaphana]
MMVVDVVFFFMCLFIPKILCQSHCVGTCYSGRLFPEPQDIFHGKHLKGYSYNNITTNDPVKCYSSCVQDCRCKACQMKDARCELLDEDKTSKVNNFVDEPGYVYFDLKQTMYNANNYLFKAKPFYVNYSVNQDRTPNWEAYRLSLNDMLYFRSKATIFRATCDIQVVNPGKSSYMLGVLTEVDILKEISIDNQCKR